MLRNSTQLVYLPAMKIKTSKSRSILALSALALAASTLTGCSSNSAEGETLTVYSGQHEEFIAPFFAEFEEQTGIKLDIRYGDSAALAAQILEEGENSPADLFISQDAASLSAVSSAGLLTQLDSDILSKVSSSYQAKDQSWVGLTGRVRVFVYAPDRVSQLPVSTDDLLQSKWKGKIGIAPTNGSFQAFVSALIQTRGVTAAETWLQGIKANNPKLYEKNSQIVEAVDAGQIDVGLVNHYYVWEVSEELGRDINAKVGFFAPGDIGNLINISGAGILGTSKKSNLAKDLIKYLLSDEVQRKYASDTHEYSLLFPELSSDGLPALKDVKAPAVDLSTLPDLKATQELLVKVGLI